MGKELSEMSLEELWTLFPIILVPHDDRWREYYNDMASSIRKILSGFPVDRISHIGSILTIHAEQIHMNNHQTEEADLTYDVNLDRAIARITSTLRSPRT